MTIPELRSKLTASFEHLKGELSQIRSGRATTSLVEEVRVMAYGSEMKIRELGTISTPDAQMILISPWDKSLIKEIEHAIREQNPGLNPVPDSQVVKVPVPPLTEERRKEFVKLVNDKAEAAKHSMRNIRQDAMKDIDKRFANKEIGEDGKFSFRDKVEEVVKQTNAQIDNLGEAKKKDLMAV